ncbi:pterin-4-alpha-carbinolamine dehydratase [Acidihalobacter yilgarnensis]|uniref:Putative pterin-4-alpha-carbinolamine dehydratase n=1 Tax=Acidihalobacter yilgarnensis TaxID=2819280 RepID=A0A1D8IM69_9GAMM|nr:4a-hydroxytetrahydrobiopterin dehydratase [Acidihalobacter yilgarnensis]AOU97562.1 pterin-4-alpha-carbinolamine dehydratase [Acidihalobacter yilgarnensis]
MNTDDVGNTLRQGHCAPCEGGVPPLDTSEAARLMSGLHPDWRLVEDGGAITRELRFANFHDTMAFVNALAWIAHREDHHPDLEVGYGRCRIRYSTHAINGLSQNDFICAAHIDALNA